MTKQIVLIVHNVRSCHNVGSLLRSADAFSVNKIFLTGYTPYPKLKNDNRLPHLANRIDKQIDKTALGAQNTTDWDHVENIKAVIAGLKKDGFLVAALEQAKNSISLPDFETDKNIALIVGREVEGIETQILDICDVVLEIPMKGKKESLNVANAAAIAMYHLSYNA
jgi:23S rRNA (guanosine2251-2'-O)-methyltransferase